jgi:hypothetical protein
MKNSQIKEAKRRKLASDLHGSIMKWWNDKVLEFSSTLVLKTLEVILGY